MNRFARTALSVFFAASMLCLSCGAPAMPVSQRHDSLSVSVEPVDALRIERNPPLEICAVPQPGMTTVVDFWATWCKPCIDSMGEIEALWGRVDRTRVAIVGVAIDEEAEPVRVMIPSLKVTFPMVYDSAGVLDEAFRVGRRVPSTFIVDAKGKVRFFVGGAKDEKERKEQIARLEQAIAVIVAEGE